MKKRYHILDSAKQQPVSPHDLTRLLSQNAQLMLPLVELVEQCRGAVDEVIDVTGRAAIQAVLELSAQQVTGGELSQPGKKRASDVVRWGRQPGRVRLSNRKLRVSKPRLRKRSGGEVEVPAYAAMQDDERLGARMLDILMKGVSTRNYAGVIGAMAGTVGVSKSAVSQETIEAAEKSIDEVLTRRLDELDLLVIYVDGLIFSDHVVLAAVGVLCQNTIGRLRREIGVDPRLPPSAGRCVVGLAAALTASFSHQRTHVCFGRRAVRKRGESERAEITRPAGSSN